MLIKLNLNGRDLEAEVPSGELLLETLRRLGCWSVKHGCETGECGSCSILLDDRLVPSCLLPAAYADGHRIQTVEGMAKGTELHPIQAAFMETGAIQCGYCTPGMLLATKTLLDKERTPDLAQAREALSAVLCRCTGYVKPVEAVMRAAAMLRGEPVPPLNGMPSTPEELSPLFERHLPETCGSVSDLKCEPARPAGWSALPSKRWTPCAWQKATRPLPTISPCPGCSTPNY
jgi:putative selenate reductase molybdopterin-binding subunit